MNEVADSCITSHIQKAVMTGVRRDDVHSNNTDAVVYLLYDIHFFINLDIKNFLIKFGIRDKSRHKPVQKLGFVFGT